MRLPKSLTQLAFVLAISITLLLSQAVAPTTQSDYSGTSATVQLFPSGSNARWVQLIAPTANTSPIRWGDSATTSTRGGIMVPGSSQFLPPLSPDSNSQLRYDLTKLYAYVVTGDKLTVVYAN